MKLSMMINYAGGFKQAAQRVVELEKVGLDVAPVHLRSVLGKDVLLSERFDRVRSGEHWRRRAMVSALTLFELDEMMAAYASYQDP